MANTLSTADIFKTYTSIRDTGHQLGDIVEVGGFKAKLCKAAVPLSKGNLVYNPALLNLDSVTLTKVSASVFTFTTNANLEENQLTGAIALIRRDEDTDKSEWSVIAANTAGESGDNVTITLVDDLSFDVGADCYVDVYSPVRSVSKTPANTLTTPAAAVVPVNVSSGEYFWGLIAPSICGVKVTVHSTAVAGEKLSPGGATAGEAILVANSETVDDVFIIGTIIAGNPIGSGGSNQIALVRLENVG